MKKRHIVSTIDSNETTLVKTEILGITITNEKKEKILEYVVSSLEKTKKKYMIVTPNPEMIVYAHSHNKFASILNSAEIALCDGMQLFRAAKFLNTSLEERISGVDFLEMLCERISKKPITVGFLGGKNGVAELAALCLKKKYPGLRVVFASEDVDKLPKESMVPKSLSVDILFVAFGFPKQEEWMYTNLSKYNVRVMMGVGGSFDYLSGKVRRAPVFLQRIGLEWLFRLVMQPWRLKRQLQLITFILLVLKEKFRSNKSS